MSASPTTRPTGITILSILAGLGGITGLLSGFAVLALGSAIFGGMGAILGLAVLAYAGLSLANAWAFWTMKPWGWPLGVVLAAAGIILAVVQFLGANANIVSTIISIAVSGVILYYLNQPSIKSLFGRA
jgi:uncharacterized membrane protein (DUF2068 family)